MLKFNFYKKYFVLWLVIIIWINYNTFFQTNNNSTQNSTSSNTITVSTWSIKESIEVSWEAQLVDEQSLSFNKEWTITKVNLRAWDEVKKWDIIAEIDNSDAYDSIDEAKINLENAKISLTQLYEWADESQVLQAKNSITTAENNLNIAQKEYENLKVSQQNSLNELLTNIETSKKELETLNENLEISKKELETLIKEKSNSYDNSVSNKSSTITNIEDSFKTNLVDIEKAIEEADYILWVTEANKDVNNGYEEFLSAKNNDYKTNAKSLLLESISLYTQLKKDLSAYDYSGDKDKIETLLKEFLTAYNKLYEMTDYTYKAVDNSITSMWALTQSQIDSMKSTMSSYRSSSLSKVSSINSTLNTLNTLTDIDLLSESNQNSISSKQSSIKSSELSIEKQKISIENSLKNYEETKSSYAVSLESKEKDIESKKVSLEIAKLNLEELLEWPTEENIRKAQNSIKQAELKLESAYKNLEDYRLESPFDWVVRKIDYMVWDNLTNDTSKYVYIENPNLLEITVMLDQIDITKVKLNWNAIIIFDAFSDIEVKAIISSIDTEPIQSSWVVSYKVKLVLNDENFDKKILSWMTANVEIIIESKENILTLKSSTITKENWKNYVNLIKNWQTIKTEIVTWISANWLTEVVSWLNKWDEIATEEFKVNSLPSSSSSLFSPPSWNSSGNRSSSSNDNFWPPWWF